MLTGELQNTCMADTIQELEQLTLKTTLSVFWQSGIIHKRLIAQLPR